jgi:hypothetical protein
VFPRKFTNDFAEIGIDVNDPQFGMWWPAPDHQAQATAYNNAWEAFFGSNPTRDEAISFGRSLMQQFNLPAAF